MRSAILRRGRSLGRADQGFTLTEVMVTLFVISAVLLGLITVQVRALASTALAKERQQATALANRSMEQLRALPYDTVGAGLRACDTTADPYIVSGAFNPAYDNSINETLVTNSTACTGANVGPLYPHQQVQTVGSTDFDVRTYVTQAGTSGAQGYFLTVVVEWASSNTNGETKIVATRSRAFSPTGCSSTSTATRPFAGPCQAFFYSDAGMAPSGITVSAVDEGAPLVTGSPVTRLEAKLPSLSVRTQNEQIVSAQSISTVSKLLLVDGSEVVSGGQAGSSSADTDPASGNGNSPTAATSAAFGGANPLSSTGSTTANFSVRGPGGDTGSAYSTTTAAASPACKDSANVALVSGQACSSAEMTVAGTYRARMDIALPGGSVSPVDLATISAGTGSWRAFGARAVLPVGGHCAGTSGIGCVAAGATRSIGAVNVGALPTARAGDATPSNFQGMVLLDGFSASTASESGISPASFTPVRGANVLYLWNGAGYDALTLGPAGASYTLAPAVGTYRLAGVTGLTINLSGTVTVDPVSVASEGSAPCTASACTTTSTVGAVRATVQYELADGSGALLGRFLVTVDLGTTMAQTTYKAAPSA